MYSIAVAGHETVEFGKTLYKVLVHRNDSGESTWLVKHRFSEFIALRRVLQLQHPSKVVPLLPAKSLFAYFSGDSFHNERSTQLEIFLRAVLQDVEPTPQSVALREFLGITRPPSAQPRAIEVGDCSDGLLISEDTLSLILGLLSAGEVVRASSVSRVWRNASLSVSLWSSVRIQSKEYEKKQMSFIRWLSSTCTSLKSLDLDVSFSSQVDSNLRLSLPEDIVFPSLEVFKLSTNSVPLSGLAQDILDAVISSDHIDLKKISLRGTITSELIRTLLSLSRLGSLESFDICFTGFTVDIGADLMSSLVDLLELSASSLTSFTIRLEYPEVFPEFVPDSYFGERTGAYVCQDRLLALLDTKARYLQTFHWPFFSANKLMRLDSFTFPPSLRDLDLRFVTNGIGQELLSEPDGRSLLTQIFTAIPAGVRSVRLSSIGVDEAQILSSNSVGPSRMPPRLVNFEPLFANLAAEWASKFTSLRDLQLEGPGLGLDRLFEYVIGSGKLNELLACFPRLKRFNMTHGVGHITEESVKGILDRLMFLERLALIGCSEKLTDSLLCQLGGLGAIRTGTLKQLRLPKTRYMSSIGMEGIMQTCSRTCDVSLVNDVGLITGRPRAPLSPQMERKFIFIRD